MKGRAITPTASRFDGRLRLDNGLAARQALIEGRGIAPAHVWLVSDLLDAGALEVVLPEYAIPSVALNLLIVPERAAIARVRLLINFIKDRAGVIPGIER